MMRLVMFPIVATAIACLAVSAPEPGWSQQAAEAPNKPEEPEGFRSLLEADIVPMEAMLGVTGDTATQVDTILQDGVEKRLAVLEGLGIVYGETPALLTLLQLQAQMNEVTAGQQAALSKILTKDQMKILGQMAEASQENFKKILLGQ